MSVLGPPPIPQPTKRAAVRRFAEQPASSGSSTVRLATQTSATTLAPGLDLETEFDRLNRLYFGGALPSRYEFIYDDTLEADVGGCFRGDSIHVKRGMTPDKTRAVLLHEMVHAYQLDGPEITLDVAEPHGPDFQRIARMIDPDGAPRDANAAEGWQPVNPAGSVVRGNDIPPRLLKRDRGIETRSCGAVVRIR